MDADIQFGEVEQERPRVMRRPDENRHFGVVACGAPREADLPIFVDLDAMLEMESHASSNTQVELGGVLLGGQYVDSQGESFVVVSDCLRADHYEATKGSFKFTHDTWSDISRRLEEFPEDLRMVGWYHTHPDWGVFLSGMDTFICDNFFNKPLDLALVIDPCRGDRGWFQWTPLNATGARRRSTQRTGGFYLISSRFRGEELEHWASVWEGSADMPVATRSGSQSTGGYGAPVVNVVQDRSSQWTQVAVLGSLALQTVLVAVLALAVLGRNSGSTPEDHVTQAQREHELRLEAKAETLDRIARQITEDENFATSLAESEAKRRSLESMLSTADVMKRQQDLKIAELEKDVSAADKKNTELVAAREKLLASNDRLEKLLADKRTAEKKAESEDGKESSGFSWKSPWLWAAGAIGLAMVVLGAVMFRSPREGAEVLDSELRPARRAPVDPPESKEPPSETNTQ